MRDLMRRTRDFSNVGRVNPFELNKLGESGRFCQVFLFAQFLWFERVSLFSPRAKFTRKIRIASLLYYDRGDRLALLTGIYDMIESIHMENDCR